MPSRIETAVHTKAFDYPVAEHWGGGDDPLKWKRKWAKNEKDLHF